MDPRQAIVLADGDVSSRVDLDRAWPGWARPDALVIAADGGVRHAVTLGLNVDRWVGDGDSTEEPTLAALAAAGVAVERSPVDKDESDAELAVLAACALGAEEVVIVGALGGPRLDHALANLGLLAMAELAGRPASIVAADARVRLLRAPVDGGAATLVLEGRIGDIVTLLPVGGDALGVTTLGLRYPLRDERLREGRSRGLSNVRTERAARVTVREGRLLVVESPASL